MSIEIIGPEKKKEVSSAKAQRIAKMKVISVHSVIVEITLGTYYV